MCVTMSQPFRPPVSSESPRPYSVPPVTPRGIWIVRHGDHRVVHVHLVCTAYRTSSLGIHRALCDLRLGDDWVRLRRSVPLPSWLSVCPLCLASPRISLDLALRIERHLLSREPLTAARLMDRQDATGLLPRVPFTDSLLFEVDRHARDGAPVIRA